jgi:ABC-2 type transport system ATP-binding protein
MNSPAILIDHVSKRFGRRGRAVDALQGVSISVEPGEIYGLLGRNGAGKTTLIKILLDIVRPDSGTTRLGGLPSRTPASRQSVGYLPEDHQFPAYQTGAGALRFYAALSGCTGRSARRRIVELLDSVELGPAMHKKIRTYSKGMKQRLGLAQALSGDPDLLFLDEPTDGVDPVGRAQIRDMLLRLKKEGKTIFLNSHLLGETERICDRVGILDDGRLVEEGSIAALTTSGCVYRIGTDPAPEDLLIEAVRTVVIDAGRVESGLEIHVDQDADVDRVIDLIRNRGVGIRSLVAKRRSLEEVFLATLGQESPEGRDRQDADSRKEAGK